MGKKPVPKPKPPAAKKPVSPVRGPGQYLVYGSMIVLFILSMVLFSPTTGNEFIETWDDGAYVIRNATIHDLSWQGIVKMFSYGDEFQKLVNNYHPVTTLSLAVNYNISGLSPRSYHVTNMIFHGLNAALVFLFIFLLSRRKLWPALISGLLFAVHPMHVESVAWISERKDVLYVFFFLAGLIAYLKYLEDQKLWKLGISLLLFLFSCLSKAMAVPFPVVLLLIDYLHRRKFSWKMLLEKIPFFIIALVIGWMSVNLQALSAIGKFETFTLYQRTMHGSYGFITYIVDFYYPSGLSAFYPYPAITTTGLLPLSFRVAPFVFMAVVALLAWTATRKGEMPRVIVFGILFYFFTIALVLQFLSVGKAIMADRYTYIPYIGLAFILGMLTDHYLQRKDQWKFGGYVLAAAVIVMSIAFAVKTFERTKIWKNDITLWSDVLQKYPDSRLNFIREKRARKLLDKEQFDGAMADYQTMVVNDPRDIIALEAIGRLYGKHYNDLGKAVEYLERAYEVNPKNSAVLMGLGVAMGMKGDYQKSLEYLLQDYELNKTDTSLIKNISATYHNMGLHEKARQFERQAIVNKSK